MSLRACTDPVARAAPAMAGRACRGFGALVLLLALLGSPAAPARAEVAGAGMLDHTPWARVFERVMQYPASQRPQLINHVVNDFDYHPSGDPARWLTPDELAQRGAGDCRDLALAKFWLLRQAGTPPERVRIAYTRWDDAGVGRYHLVVLLWTDAGEPWVLDNLVAGMHRLSQRPDLQVFFSFDERRFFERAGQRQIGEQPLQGWRGLWDRLPVLAATARPRR
jgi:hypothetical protein